MIKGNVNSIQSLGALDGPGIRFVVFMQGCPLRCLYCHNPDTWETGIGQKISAAQILEEYQNKDSRIKIFRLAKNLKQGAARNKGINDSLVMVDSLAFIVNIPNNTVVTAIDKNETINNVFTNIDGAVIM